VVRLKKISRKRRVAKAGAAVKQPLVAIVIPNYNGQVVQYNGKGILENLLESLMATSYRNMKVIVSDDSSPSPDASAGIAAKYNVKFIVNKPNGGFAKNANFGAKYAIDEYDPDYILWLNNDIIITDPDWLTKLVETAESDPKIGMVGCKLLYPDGKIQRGYSPDERNQQDSEKFDYVRHSESVDGAMFFAKRAVIDRVGLFDEMFLFGWEDADYCMRVRDAGFKFVYNGKVKLMHLEGATSTAAARNNGRYKRSYNDMVSFIRFMWKHNSKFTLSYKLHSVLNMAASVFVTTNESVKTGFKLGKYRFNPDPLTKIRAYYRATMDVVSPHMMFYRFLVNHGLGRLLINGAVRKLQEEAKACRNIEDIVNLAYAFDYHGITIGPFQIKEEIMKFAEDLSNKQPQEILEIGTAKGGTLFIIAQCAPDNAHIISLDLPNGKFGGGYPSWKIPLYRSFVKKGQMLELVRENSHDIGTFETVRKLLNDKKLDLLFIDADRSYDGVKHDFNMYSVLVKESGTIAMHDISKTPNPEISVQPFWDEIKKKHRTKEIIENPMQGYGIGIINMK
jgi:GT2 family glycosyltransferase/predicted O-methyltransferase YrrM